MRKETRRLRDRDARLDDTRGCRDDRRYDRGQERGAESAASLSLVPKPLTTALAFGAVLGALGTGYVHRVQLFSYFTPQVCRDGQTLEERRDAITRAYWETMQTGINGVDSADAFSARTRTCDDADFGFRGEARAFDERIPEEAIVEPASAEELDTSYRP